MSSVVMRNRQIDTVPPIEKMKATAEQIRIATLIAPAGRQQEDQEAIQRKIKQITDLTGRSELEASSALYDCDNNVDEAICQLLESEKATKDQWITQGDKKKKKQHQVQTVPSETATDNHVDHSEDLNGDGYSVEDGSGSCFAYPDRDDSNAQFGGPKEVRGSRGRNGGSSFREGSDAPPRFRGRGGALRTFANNSRRSERENEPAVDDAMDHIDQFNSESCGDRGPGFNRGRGGFSRGRGGFSDRGVVGRPGRGRGGATVPTRRGVDRSEPRFSSGSGGGRGATWTNSSKGGSRDRDDNVWDNNMAKQYVSHSQRESNTWDNSMADAVLKKNGANRADTSQDDWAGEDDWTLSGTRVFTNQAAPPEIISGQGTGVLGTFSTLEHQIKGSTTGSSHFQNSGESIDINLLMNKPTGPAQSNHQPESGYASGQQVNNASSWHSQATDNLKNQLGIGKVAVDNSRVPSHTQQQYRTTSESHNKAKTPVEMPGSSIGTLDVQFGNFDLNSSSIEPSTFEFGTVDLSFQSTPSMALSASGNDKALHQPQRIGYQRTPNKADHRDTHMNGPSDLLSGGSAVGAKDSISSSAKSQTMDALPSMQSSVHQQQSAAINAAYSSSAVDLNQAPQTYSMNTQKLTGANDRSQYDVDSQQQQQGLNVKPAANNSKLSQSITSNISFSGQQANLSASAALPMNQQQQQTQQQQSQQQQMAALASAVAQSFPYNQGYSQLNAAATPYMPAPPFLNAPFYGQQELNQFYQQQLLQQTANILDVGSLGQQTIIPSSREGNSFAAVDMKGNRMDGAPAGSIAGLVSSAANSATVTAAPPPAPPGLTPSVTNAQTAAMVAGLTNYAYNPYLFSLPQLQAYPPMLMQPQVTQTTNSAAFQKTGSFPPTYSGTGNMLYGYDDAIPDYGKQGGFTNMTAQVQPQVKSGNLNASAAAATADISKAYGQQTVGAFDPSKPFVQHTGTPPPFNALNFFQSAQVAPQGAYVQGYGMPPLMHSPQLMQPPHMPSDGQRGNQVQQNQGQKMTNIGGVKGGASGGSGTYPQSYGNWTN